MNKPTVRKSGLRRTLAIGALSPLLMTAALQAQTAPEPETPATAKASEKDDDLVILDKFEVTGSHIPYAADAPAIPIKIVNVDQIAATGEASDLLEVIRKAAPQFIGNGNLGSSNSNIGGGSTNGGSQIKLRNVQTLVLINGRRAVFAPVGAVGGYNFVDVNSIPVSAVERIDILSDGASAIYGSDAVSGVVNIILKKDYDGIEIGGGFAADDRGGGWNQTSARFIAGHKVDKTSITVSAEWLKSDPVFQKDRPFSADQTNKTSTFPGVVLDFSSGYYLLNEATPGTNLDLSGADLVAAAVYEGPISGVGRRFNLSPYVTLAMGNEKKSATVVFSHELTPKLELFGDILYSQTETFYQLAAQPILGMPFTAAHVSDIGIGLGVTDLDHPQNPFDSMVLVLNRFVDHPRRYYADTDTIRVLTGLRGDINTDWTWEGALNFNSAKQDYRNENVIDRLALSNAIDSGVVNLFAKRQSEEAMKQADIFGTAWSKNKSSLFSGDLRVNGRFPSVLPGGSIDVAFGGEFRRETLSANPDDGSNTNTDLTSPQFGMPERWDGATTTDFFDASRTIKSAFTEIRVPITGKQQKIPGLHTLELDVAARYDNYSDTDDPIVPKVLLRWLPFNDDFAIRATYSESFSAQDLYSLFGPTGVGFTDSFDTFECFDGRMLTSDDDGIDQGHLRIPPNANLRPEKSKNWNLGFVFTPSKVKGLSVEVGYFNIRQTDIVGSVSDTSIMQDVELKGTASEYADRVLIGGFAGDPITAPGQISAVWDSYGTFSPVYVTTFGENFVSAKQDGVDFTVEYGFDAEPIGEFTFEVAGYWFNSFSVDGEEYVGTTNGRSVLNGGTVPRWLGTLRGRLTRGKWKTGFNLEYIPKVVDTDGEAEEERHVKDFARLDLWTSYQFEGGEGWRRYIDGLTVRCGVNNVTNEMPPVSPSWNDESGADTATYGMLGRMFFVDASYKF